MDSFAEIERLRGREKRAALATLVATRGTSPRKEGARMWVGENGAILGAVTIGGCIDAEVVRASERVLRGSSPELISLELGDDDAHALGLTCAGTVDVLVRSVELDAPDALIDALSAARHRVEAGGRAVVVTPLPGEAGAETGELLVVMDDGTLRGTLGTTALDAKAAALAVERMERGGSRTLTVSADGKAVEAYFDVHGRAALLLIVGAGAITLPLTIMGRALGMHVVVVESRERFAESSRFPEANEVITGMPSEIVAAREYDASSAIVLVAHDHRFDIPALREAVRSDAGYVGMLGSRRRAATILDMLRAEGVTEEAIGRIRTPIGLDTGGQTAGEIALSILAEVVAVRNGRTGGAMRDRESAAGRTIAGQR